MVEFGFYEGLGAGDVDAVLADELLRGHVMRAKGFGDQRNSALRFIVSRLDSDLVQDGFVIKRYRARPAEVDMCLTAEMYLADVVDGDVVTVKSTLLLNTFELDPISVQ